MQQPVEAVDKASAVACKTHPVIVPLVPCSEQSEQVNAAMLLKDLPPTMREALKVRVGLARTRSGRMAPTQVSFAAFHLHLVPVFRSGWLLLHLAVVALL